MYTEHNFEVLGLSPDQKVCSVRGFNIIKYSSD